MHVGIYLFFPRHAPNVIPLIRALPRVVDRVTLYTIPRLIEEIGASHPGIFDAVELVVAEGNELPEIRALLPQIISDSHSKLDALHFDDIPDFWFAQTMKPGCPCTLTVHNMNMLFNRWNRFKSFEWRRMYYNWRIKRNFTAFNTMGVNQAETLKRLPFQNKPVFRFPPRIFDPEKIAALKAESTYSNGKLLFSVVGSIDEVRRNYTLTLDAFERLFRDFPDRVRLALLGFSSHQEYDHIIDRAEAIRAAGGDVVSFRKSIPQPEYDKWLAATDFLISPNNARTRSEAYGVTKVAGDLADRIQWALPNIVSSSYIQDAEFTDATISFEGADGLYSVIANLINDPARVQNLKDAAHRASSAYSIENATAYFRDKVLPLLK